MKKRLQTASGFILVFIDNGKSGAAHHIFHPFCITQCMNKSGFSRPHCTMKGKYFFPGCLFPETGSGIFYIIQGKDQLHGAKVNILIM